MKQDEKLLHLEEEKHTAMGSIAGYVFQYYFFLYKLLTIEYGSIVSFEKLDDTATEKDQAITFFQIKHTVQAALGGKDNSLTDRASDLWKALDVWRKLITGENGIERSEEEQQVYINEHEFVLVSNKRFEDNKLAKLCNKIRESKISDDEIDEILNSIIAKAKNRKSKDNEEKCDKKSAPTSTVQSQINALKGFKLRKEFLCRVRFEFLSFDDIIQKSNFHIRGMHVARDQIQGAFDDFKSEVDKDLMECAKTGSPLSYDYEKKLERFDAVFQNRRADSLDFRIKKEKFRPDFCDLICIKQLVKVGDIKEKNTDKIARVVSHFLSFKNRFNELSDNFKITTKDFENFYENTISFWKNHFESVYDDIDENADEKEITESAKKLLGKIRDFEVSLCKEKLLIPISNGAFYYLSDECQIGWHREWEKFFKNQQ